MAQVQVHTTATRYEPAPAPGGATTYAQHHRNYDGRNYNNSSYGGVMSLFSENGPSASQIMAVFIGVPIGGTLLFLAGMSLVASLIGLAIVTPLFILFSPVLVPTVLTIGLAVAGILTSNACGLTGLMSLSWVARYVREMQGMGAGRVDAYGMVKGRVADMADYVGQKTKDVGQKTKEVGHDIQTKAHEAKRTT